MPWWPEQAAIRPQTPIPVGERGRSCHFSRKSYCSLRSTLYLSSSFDKPAGTTRSRHRAPCGRSAKWSRSPRTPFTRLEHRQSRYWNNRAENSRRPTRRREWQKQRFKSPEQAQDFRSATRSSMATSIRADTDLQPVRAIRSDAFNTWQHEAPTCTMIGAGLRQPPRRLHEVDVTMPISASRAACDLNVRRALWRAASSRLSSRRGGAHSCIYARWNETFGSHRRIPH